MSKRIFWGFSFLFLGLVASLLMAPVIIPHQATAQTQQQRPNSFADLADQVVPSVVNISTTQIIDRERQSLRMMPMPDMPQDSPFNDFFEEFFNGPFGGQGGMGEGDDLPAPRAQSLGSGFIIDGTKGHVVTNNHVVERADEIQVILHDDTTLDADVIGRDPKTDLAVLQVDFGGKDVQAVTWGNSDTMRVGDWVMAVGNPFGLGGTVTAGIISARQRNINAGPYDDFLQTDASINRGNSGGPMFDMRGRVIGINTAIYSPSGGSVGIGFAIPSDLAQPVIDQLIEFGQTRRGWLGVQIQTVTDDIAESLGMQEPNGAMVADVTEGSPADRAGLKVGDVIISFNGQKIEEMRFLPRIVADTKIGSTAKVQVLRDGEELTKDVTIAQLETAEAEGLIDNEFAEAPQKPSGATEFKELGLSLSPITSSLRQKYGLERDQDGLIIREVDPAGDAASKGIGNGNILVSLNQKPVDSLSDVRDQIDAAKTAGRETILALVHIRGNSRFVALRLQADDTAESDAETEQ